MKKTIKSIAKIKPFMKKIIHVDKDGIMKETEKEIKDEYLITYINGSSVALRLNQFEYYGINLNDAITIDNSLKNKLKSEVVSKQVNEIDEDVDDLDETEDKNPAIVTNSQSQS